MGFCEMKINVTPTVLADVMDSVGGTATDATLHAASKPTTLTTVDGVPFIYFVPFADPNAPGLAGFDFRMAYANNPDSLEKNPVWSFNFNLHPNGSGPRDPNQPIIRFPVAETNWLGPNGRQLEYYVSYNWQEFVVRPFGFVFQEGNDVQVNCHVDEFYVGPVSGFGDAFAIVTARGMKKADVKITGRLDLFSPVDSAAQMVVRGSVAPGGSGGSVSVGTHDLASLMSMQAAYSGAHRLSGWGSVPLPLVIDGFTGVSVQGVLSTAGVSTLANNAPVAIEVGESEFTWMNPLTRDIFVYVDGGSVSSIRKAGVEIFASTGKAVPLRTGQSISIIYSEMPTMRYD